MYDIVRNNMQTLLQKEIDERLNDGKSYLPEMVDPMSDREKEIKFDCKIEKIEYLTIEQIIDKYGDMLTVGDITRIQKIQKGEQ